MVEPIEKLRGICQKGRVFLPRRISIYYTKLFLTVGISANQTTVLWLVLGLISGVFFGFGGYLWSLIGGLLYYQSAILDYVDGEIARYRKSVSSSGQVLESIGHILVDPFIFILGASFGAYNMFGGRIVFMASVFAISGLFLVRSSSLNLSSINHKAMVDPSRKNYTVLRSVYNLSGNIWVRANAVLIAAIIDFLSYSYGIRLPFNCIFMIVIFWGVLPFVWVAKIFHEWYGHNKMCARALTS